MGQIRVSICVPTLGLKLNEISEQIHELAKSKSKETELVFSLYSQSPNVSSLLTLTGGHSSVFVHDKSSTFDDNLKNAVENAQGDHLLFLGDDDLITAGEILKLEKYLDHRGTVTCGFTQYSSKNSRGRDLSSQKTFAEITAHGCIGPAASFFRAGKLPGILLEKKDISFDFFEAWMRLYPHSIYPQIILAASTWREKNQRACLLPVTVLIGEGAGFLDPTFERLSDYGVEERLVQTKLLYAAGLLDSFGVIWTQIKLALWVSSRFQDNHIDYPQITSKILRRQLLLFNRFPLFSGVLAAHRLFTFLRSLISGKRVLRG